MYKRQGVYFPARLWWGSLLNGYPLRSDAFLTSLTVWKFRIFLRHKTVWQITYCYRGESEYCTQKFFQVTIVWQPSGVRTNDFRWEFYNKHYDCRTLILLFLQQRLTSDLSMLKSSTTEIPNRIRIAGAMFPNGGARKFSTLLLPSDIMKKNVQK